MNLVLKYRNSIYGFLILWIVFFHIERVINLPIHIPIISPFIQRGNSAVDIFMFLSGFCLCLSLKKNYNLKIFYTKRFKRVVISYLVIAVPFFIWKSLEEFSSMRFAHFLFDLSGLSFWLKGCQNAWFVHAIILFYIFTPILFKIVRKGILVSLIWLSLIFFLILEAYYHIPSFYYSSIAWSRLPIFFIGIIMAYYLPHFEFQNRRLFVLLSILFGVVLLSLLPNSFKGIYSWLLYAFIVIPLLWVSSSTFKRIPDFLNSAFSLFGKISLEIYICHIMILHIFRFYRIDQSMNLWLYLLLPAITIPCSLFAFNFSKRLSKNIL